MLDEWLKLDQPTVDHCPRLAIAGGEHLGAGDSAPSEFAPDQLYGIQPRRADLWPVDTRDVAASASSDKQIEARGPTKIPRLVYGVEAEAFANQITQPRRRRGSHAAQAVARVAQIHIILPPS